MFTQFRYLNTSSPACRGPTDLFAELLAVETELIDSYVKGAMSPHERARFERYFLRSAERRQRVEFCKKFRRAT